MNDTDGWTSDSDELLVSLIGPERSTCRGDIVVARYPDQHSVIWFTGLQAPIDASGDALDRLVTAGFLVWDESPRPLRRLRVTRAGYLHARDASRACPVSQD